MRTELFLAGLIGLPMIGLPMIGGATGMAVAQESRYSSEWRAPTSAAASAQAPVDATTQQFVDELQALVDSAADANAADPRFLQDLRELALRYTWPWRTLIASDDFGDGNHSENPAWRVSQGTFTVEVDVGLRTAVAAAVAESARSSGGSATSPEQLAVSILGALLSGNKASQSESRQPETVETAAAAGQINLDTTIPNAFALRAAGARADTDPVVVTAQNAPVPNARPGADGDITDHDGTGCDEGRGVDVWRGLAEWNDEVVRHASLLSQMPPTRCR